MNLYVLLLQEKKNTNEHYYEYDIAMFIYDILILTIDALNQTMTSVFFVSFCSIAYNEFICMKSIGIICSAYIFIERI
jgi:hypothetical protein